AVATDHRIGWADVDRTRAGEARRTYMSARSASPRLGSMSARPRARSAEDDAGGGRKPRRRDGMHHASGALGAREGLAAVKLEAGVEQGARHRGAAEEDVVGEVAEGEADGGGRSRQPGRAAERAAE